MSLIAAAVSSQAAASVVTTSWALGKLSHSSAPAVIPDRSSHSWSISNRVAGSVSHSRGTGSARCCTSSTSSHWKTAASGVAVGVEVTVAVAVVVVSVVEPVEVAVVVAVLVSVDDPVEVAVDDTVLVAVEVAVDVAVLVVSDVVVSVVVADEVPVVVGESVAVVEVGVVMLHPPKVPAL
jgi:hypothetical protein